MNSSLLLLEEVEVTFQLEGAPHARALRREGVRNEKVQYGQEASVLGVRRSMDVSPLKEEFCYNSEGHGETWKGFIQGMTQKHAL